jgi:hypothetical protein
MKDIENDKNKYKNMSTMTTAQKNFTFNSDPKNGVSICIPRVFKNIPHWRIKKHFIDANLGFVERVDVIHVAPKDPNKRGYKRAYVHFAPMKWNMKDPFAKNVLRSLQQKKEVTIMYEDPWFWKIVISSSKRPSSPPGSRSPGTVENSVPRDIAIDLAKRRIKQPKKKIDLGEGVTAISRDGDDPWVARAMNSTPSPKLSTLQNNHLGKVETLTEKDPDYGEYSHLSEQVATFMMQQDEMESQKNIKELSSV